MAVITDDGRQGRAFCVVDAFASRRIHCEGPKRRIVSLEELSHASGISSRRQRLQSRRPHDLNGKMSRRIMNEVSDGLRSVLMAECARRVLVPMLGEAPGANERGTRRG